MRFALIFLVTFYFLYEHANCNQQDLNDPSKPFWAARGRRSGLRVSTKGDDDISPPKWLQDEDDNPPELSEKDLTRRREQATSLLANILNMLATWDGEVVRKRGDGKASDPNNPFWAARG